MVKYNIYFFIALIMTASGEQSLGQESPQDIVNKCISAQHLLDQSSTKLVTDIKLTYPDSRPKIQRASALIVRDGDRIDLDGEYSLIDKDQEGSYKFRAVVNDEYYVEYQHDKRWDGKPSGSAAKAQRKSHRDLFLETSSYGGPLDGFSLALGGKRFTEHLQNANDLKILAEETVDGIPCSVVSAHTKYGQITAWIAPPLGYCCVKYKIERSGDDLWTDNKPISKIPPYTTSAEQSDQRKISRVESVLNNVKVESIDGKHIPTEGQFVESIFRNGGSTIITNCIYKRSEIILDPKDFRSDAYIIDLPKNSPVSFSDDNSSGVKYKWNGSSVEASYDPTEGEEVGFLPGRSTTGIVIGLNLTLITIVIVTVYIRKTRGPTR